VKARQHVDFGFDERGPGSELTYTLAEQEVDEPQSDDTTAQRLGLDLVCIAAETRSSASATTSSSYARSAPAMTTRGKQCREILDAV